MVNTAILKYKIVDQNVKSLSINHWASYEGGKAFSEISNVIIYTVIIFEYKPLNISYQRNHIIY